MSIAKCQLLNPNCLMFLFMASSSSRTKVESQYQQKMTIIYIYEKAKYLPSVFMPLNTNEVNNNYNNKTF